MYYARTEQIPSGGAGGGKRREEDIGVEKGQKLGAFSLFWGVGDEVVMLNCFSSLCFFVGALFTWCPVHTPGPLSVHFD